MNFDMNMLSTLLQLIGGKQDTAVKNDDRQNSSEQRCYAQSADAKPVQKTDFCKQNGLGEILTPKQDNSASNIFQALQGGDNSILPMLINMFSKPKSAESGQNISTSSDSHTGIKQSNYDIKTSANKTNKNSYTNYANSSFSAQNQTLNSDLFDCDKKFIKRKTQPNLFDPIAFAGYNLVCAVCKLYVTSQFDLCI